MKTNVNLALKYVTYKAYIENLFKLDIYILILTRGLREFSKGNMQFVYMFSLAHSYKLKLTNECYKNGGIIMFITLSTRVDDDQTNP